MRIEKKQALNIDKVRYEVKNVLKKFQEGYSKRDVSTIDEFVNELFIKDKNVFAVGTGDDEWFFGRDEVKELFESDWKYWGDFTLDIQNPTISTNGDVVWITAQGHVKYEFKDDKETYERYLKFIKSYFDDSNEEFLRMSQKEKLTTLNYILTHKMRDREQKERQYNWPVTFTGILIQQERKWVFKNIQFSMTTPSMYPDIRFNYEEEYKVKYSKLKTKIKKFIQVNECKNALEIKKVLEKFQTMYLNDEIRINDILSDFFSLDEDIRVIAADGAQYEGLSQIEKFASHHRKEWSKMIINTDELVLCSHGNISSFTINGIAKKSLSENEACDKQVEDLKKIFDVDACAKEKLFRIQRNISIMQKEVSKGENFVWPFRLEGVMVKRDSKWMIHCLHFSYPFNWILEGKYDVGVIE